jgi:hypothetical protein
MLRKDNWQKVETSYVLKNPKESWNACSLQRPGLHDLQRMEFFKSFGRLGQQ